MADLITDAPREPREQNETSLMGSVKSDVSTMAFKETPKYIGRQVDETIEGIKDFFTLDPLPERDDTPVEKPFKLIPDDELERARNPNSPAWSSMVTHEISEGVTSHIANAISDARDAEPDSEQLSQDLDDASLALSEKYGIDVDTIDQIAASSRSVEELTRKAKRLHDADIWNRSVADVGFMTQASAGLVGFVLDPVNLIPGAAVIKGGRIAAKMLPRMSERLMANGLGRTGTFAAMGAIEEATRLYPRLMSDPTYSYDQYKIDVALGAGFGGGIAAVSLGGRFAKNNLSKGINDALDKYKTSLESRLVVNKLTDTLGVTKNENARKAVQEAIDAALGPEAIKDAKRAAEIAKAQDQVMMSKVNQTLRNHSEKFRDQVKEGLDTKIEDTITEMVDELKRTHPTFAKIAEAIKLQKERKAAKAAAEEAQSMGSAKRKETLGTKVGDKIQDMKDDSAAFKEAMDDIDRIFNMARGVARADKDEIVQKQLEAARSVAKRAVIERAKMLGVKPKIQATTTQVHQALYQKFKNYQKKVNRLDFELNKVLKEAGVDDRNIMSPAVGQSFKKVGVVGYKAFTNAIKKDPELGKRLVDTLDENITRKIDDIYHAAPNADQALYTALDDAYKAVRADIEWARLAAKDRNIAQISMDPEWALMSHDFVQSMGNDLSILDDIYNSTFNKALRNQFGGFTRSYAGELAASRTPLAQWAALHIFELPGGTAGKVARRETAAITMEMYMAQATHPVNVAWIKAVRQEAKDQGLGMLDSAVMRHSSAAADKNANALGRKIQLEMNARQMGQTTNAPTHIKEFADELEKAYDFLYKKQHENGVEGINGDNKIKAYMSQKWSEARVLDEVIDGELGLDGFNELVVSALRKRNKDATQAELEMRAKTVVDRMLDMVNNREGKSGRNIVTDGDYINERVLHLDLDTTITKNGKTYHLLDFMSNDVVSDLTKYAKKSSSTAAISRASGGKLNSADAISSFIHAVGQESDAMGTHVDVGTLTDAFKLMQGEPIKAFDPRARKIRDAVALSGMNGLGESQLAELGLAMNRGMASLFAAKQIASRVAGKYRTKFRGLELTPEQAKNTALLEEMQSVSTLYEQMHNFARQNVHFDDSYGTESKSAFIRGLNTVVDKGTGGKYRPVLQHIQTKYTDYGSIRTMQEQVAMAGLMHDVGRKLAGKASKTSDARLADIGVPMDLLRKKMADGSIQLDAKGNIETLGLSSWSEAERHSLGVALRRHSGQVIQTGFAGESSAWMSNPWVAFMMQFRSYPNIAAEKQQMRHAMFHDKEAAMSQVLNAASSMAARAIRYQSLAMAVPEDKRERYLKRKYDNLAHDTLLYMGGVGSMMNTYDLMKDPSGITPPVFSWFNNYMKAIEGLGNGFTSRDVGQWATALPIGTISYANMITGRVKDMMEADADETPRLPEGSRLYRGN